MRLKTSIAIAACKLARFGLRKLGRGGTDLPGRIALKLCPDLLGRLAKDVTVIIVTGTNGKTTTSRMIEQAVYDAGIFYLANRSGANLLSGVTAEFCAASSILRGSCTKPFAVIEADEAAFKAISRYVEAKAIVVTNVFRDQLDRYGEVTHTLDNIRIGIENSPNAVVCLNADDSLVSSLADVIPNEILYYGVDVPVYTDRVAEVSDAPYCIRCKHEYEYSYVTYGHLGGFHCPHCGYERQLPAVSVMALHHSDGEGSDVTFRTDGQRIDAHIALPGGYNIYNACAAMAMGKAIGLDPEVTARALEHFNCGFGRMETFSIQGHSLRMILIKNPAGCNQVLNYLTASAEPVLFVACLNDRAQDGKDVSWIWDVDFEQLTAMEDCLAGIYVSGIRAEDMALRFRYAGIPTEKLKIYKEYGALMEAILAQDKPACIMPTYTAMLDLRNYITKQYGAKEFWK